MQRKLCMDRGEEEDWEKRETEWQEVAGGERKMSPERNGENKRRMGQREIGGEETKGKGIRHPQTERDTVMGEARRGRGEGIEVGRKREVETETGLERGTDIEREIETVKEMEGETGIGMEKETEMMKETERGIEIVKEIEGMTGRGTEEETGTMKETERGIEKERGPMLHHHHHHQEKIGVTVRPLLGH